MPAGGAEIHGAQFAAIQHEGELLALRLLVAAGNGRPLTIAPVTVSLPNFNSTRAPLSWSSMRSAAAPSPIWKGNSAEFVAQRVHRVVAQAGDLAAALLLDGERFQDVVHFRRH